MESDSIGLTNKGMSEPKNKKLNVRLLRRIQKFITKEPRRFFMHDFVVQVKNSSQWNTYCEIIHDLSSDMPPCGTAACIAGTANILTGARIARTIRSDERAAKALGVDSFYEWRDKHATPYRPPAHPLFLVDGWPQPFRSQYEEATTPIQRAKVACARIDLFIATKGEV